MPFSGMTKLKLRFFKSMQNKITKSIFHFSFILELKKKTKKDYMIEKHFDSEKKKKEERERRKKKREKIKRKLIKIAISILHTS